MRSIRPASIYYMVPGTILQFLWIVHFKDQDKTIVTQRLTRFVLVGGVAAAVNILSRAVISQFVSFEYAVALAYPIGLTFAFVLSRRFVFELSRRSIWAQYARFVIVNIFALIQIWAVSIGLVRFLFPAIGWTWYPELLGHTIAVASPVFTSYYAHKAFTFR